MQDSNMFWIAYITRLLTLTNLMMKKLEKMESFKSFEISKNSMNQIAGARTKYFSTNGPGPRCIKYIDSGNVEGENIRRAVVSDRFEGRC